MFWTWRRLRPYTPSHRRTVRPPGLRRPRLGGAVAGGGERGAKTLRDARVERESEPQSHKSEREESPPRSHVGGPQLPSLSFTGVGLFEERGKGTTNDLGTLFSRPRCTGWQIDPPGPALTPLQQFLTVSRRCHPFKGVAFDLLGTHDQHANTPPARRVRCESRLGLSNESPDECRRLRCDGCGPCALRCTRLMHCIEAESIPRADLLNLLQVTAFL